MSRIPCSIPALRKLGYSWQERNCGMGPERYMVADKFDAAWGVVYWSGDADCVQLAYKGQVKAEHSVRLRGSWDSIDKSAMALMAELRAEAERLLVADPEWVVVPPRGGDAHQRRVARREVARLQAQARAQVRGEGGEPKASRQGALFGATKKVEKS